MEYLQVKNWEDFQHYKDRTPPWIKLYNHLLDDFDFSCLPDASKAHLLSIWLLASRTNNRIPNNSQWISNKINATEKVDITLLINSGFVEIIGNKNNELQTLEHDASISLQTQEQSACLEREERESRERESKELISKCFESFWVAGMKKVNKKGAEKAFNAKLKDLKMKPNELSELMISDVKVRLSSGQFGFESMHPQTYINGERWNDDKQAPKQSPDGDMSWARGLR